MNSKEHAADLRQRGFNIIPIWTKTKFPRASQNEVLHWKEHGCAAEIREDDNLAMLHSKLGGTWAVDFDDPTILTDMMQDPGRVRELMIVKTPIQGHHIIFGRVEGDTPPVDTKYVDQSGRKIDIRANGYTLIPPSIHPDAPNGEYKYVNDVKKPVTMKWSNFLYVLEDRGFFTQTSHRDNFDDNYDYGVLIHGGFKRGNRRRKLNSLYAKKRIMGSTEEKSLEAVIRTNKTCIPPLTDDEVKRNVRYAERYFQHVIKPGLESKAKESAKTDKKQKVHTSVYTCAEIIQEKYSFTTSTIGEIYFYSNGVYRTGGEQVISKFCRKMWGGEDMEITTHQINEVTNIIKDATGYMDVDEFDKKYWILNLKNGLYDVRNGTFTPHTPAHKSITQYNVWYDNTARCKRFLRFLTSSLECDAVKICTVLEMMALCFLNKNIIEKAYMHVGGGSNGKSSLFNILTSMLGIQNISANTIHHFADNRFAASSLEGKAANISADIGKRGIQDTELIKKLIGGDPIECEKKHMGSYAFRPHATMIFSANELPEVSDSSDGFARKFELVKWERQFYGKQRDHTIEQIQRDKDEISGIFNLLVHVMRRLDRTRTLRFESTIEQTKTDWLEESDSIQQFVSQCITTVENAVISKQAVYTAYTQYCEREKLRAKGKIVFGDRLRSLGYVDKQKYYDGKVTRVWMNVQVDNFTTPPNRENEKLNF